MPECPRNYDCFTCYDRNTANCPVQPYSDEEAKKARLQGLYLDDWHDYCEYFGLGEEEEYE